MPLVINMASYFSYQYFLFGPEDVPMSVLALATLAILAVLAYKLMLDLYPRCPQPESKAELSAAEPPA